MTVLDPIVCYDSIKKQTVMPGCEAEPHFNVDIEPKNAWVKRERNRSW